MPRPVSLAVGSLLLLLVPVAGCAASAPGADAPDAAEADDADVATSEEALTSCGKARYAEALGHYKSAVAGAKERLASRTCEWENGYLWSIADEATQAVMICPAFKTTLRTSPWASPVRTALAESLNLAAVTGELAVLRDSSFQNWTGTEALLARGTTFWARAEGAYGSSTQVTLRAGGKATWTWLHHDPKTFEVTVKSEPATYRVVATTAKARRTVIVEHGGKTERYELGVQNPWREGPGAPLFVLQPKAGSATDLPLYSLVSECDA